MAPHVTPPLTAAVDNNIGNPAVAENYQKLLANNAASRDIHGHLLTRSRINSSLFQGGFNTATIEFCNLIGRTACPPPPSSLPPPLWKIDALYLYRALIFLLAYYLHERKIRRKREGGGRGLSRFEPVRNFHEIPPPSLRFPIFGGVIGVRYRYRDEEHSSNTRSV